MFADVKAPDWFYAYIRTAYSYGFAFGIIGFIAALIIYGGIMNPASVIMSQSTPTLEYILSAYVEGLPFDLIHALSTSIFLGFIAEPMIDKLERVKVKYGLI